MPRKKRLSDQMKRLVASRLERLVAASSPSPKKRSIYRQHSDHWQETPRYEGKFSSDSPTSRKALSFKIPEDLMQELERLAGDAKGGSQSDHRKTSANLIVKDFIVRNFTELVRQCQEENQG